MKWNLDKPKEDFKTHLDLDGNNRIIFSGIFGIGKTYFLKEFFEENEQYNYIHLYPVNYSVAKNEDIFELIKYDIFLKLQSSPNVDFEKVSKSYLKTLPKFLLKNIHNILAPALKFIPQIGKAAYDTYEAFHKLSLDAVEDHQEQNESNENKLLKFTEEINNSKGSIYENNFYTGLITKLLGNAKSKENILIIDDLDRVEPEHIFRLLNVFAAHFDNQTGEKNKFGFDKVILVFDINNVRRIFTNKYGGDVDFSGYIDKFYSTEIFYFNNKKIITDTLDEYFKLFKNKSSHYEKIDDNEHPIRKIIESILFQFIQNHQLNLRNLIKMVNNDTKLSNFSIQYKKETYSIAPAFIYDFFIKLFGEREKFTKAFNSIKALQVHDPIEWTEILLVLIDYKRHKFMTVNDNKAQIFSYNQSSISFRKELKYQITKTSKREYSCEIIEDTHNVNSSDIVEFIKKGAEDYLEIIES